MITEFVYLVKKVFRFYCSEFLLNVKNITWKSDQNSILCNYVINIELTQDSCFGVETFLYRRLLQGTCC